MTRELGTVMVTLTADTNAPDRSPESLTVAATAVHMLGSDVDRSVPGAVRRLQAAVPHPHYLGAALLKAIELRRRHRLSLVVAVHATAGLLEAGLWRPPLDVHFEEQRLADLGRRIAGLRARLVGGVR